jgi:hypothetical protein
MFYFQHPRLAFSALVACAVMLAMASDAWTETFGVMSESGEFQPKVSVDIGSKEIVITKLDPQEKFRSIAIQVSPRNSALLHNAGLLKLEWTDAQGHSGKPVPFTGPLYDPKTRTYADSMAKSVTLKIINTSVKKLFQGKPLSDLFQIKIDGQPIVSQESVTEQHETVQMGKGKEVSISVDQNSIVFTENNVKVGDILNIDNRSGKDQVLGVELPKRGWLFDKIKRRDQTEVPSDEWDRFTVPAGSGVFAVLIPDPDPTQLSQLDGKEIVIKVYDGGTAREVRRIPIKVSADLRRSGYLSQRGAAGTGPPVEASEKPASKPQPSRTASGLTSSSGMWLWGLQVINLFIVVGIAMYGLLFLLPRLRVLDDRLARNEMFIHGSREAIREEIEQIKEEVLRQCQQGSDST